MRYQELVPVVFAITARAAVPTDMFNIFWIAGCSARQQELFVKFHCNLKLSAYQIEGNIIFFTFYFNPKTPMIETEFLLTISVQYQPDK